MTCHDARELLSALLDDALSADERQRLLEHLATCSDCARERDRLAATVTLLRSVTPARAPAGFVDRVLAATRPAPWYRRWLRAALLPWPVKVPIEAAAIVLLGIGVTYLYQRTPELRDAARMPSPVEHRAPKPSEPDETEKVQDSAPLQANVDSLRSKDSAARSNEQNAVVGSQKTEAFGRGRAFDADSRKPDDFKDRERDTLARSDVEASRDKFKRDVGAPERREGGPAAQPAPATAPPASSTLSTLPPSATQPPAVTMQPPAPATPPPVAVTPPVAASAPSAARGSVSEPQAKEQAARNLTAPQDRASPQATTPDTHAQRAPLPQAPAAGAPAQKTAKALDARVESRVAKMRRAPDVIGRLSVANRSEAEHALLELVARHTGTLVDRRVDGDSPVLTFDVPRASYVAFARDLAGLGRFTADREPGASGDVVEIVLTLE